MGLRDVVNGWGSTPAERATPLACDAIAPDATSVLVRAVNVAAPPATVYRWLCQLREAPYSYDWIDNFGRRSPRELTPGADELDVGQRMVAIFRLAHFEPGRSITIESRGLLGHVVATYLVTERPEGGSRLVLRFAWRPPRLPLARPLLSIGDLVMARRQLLNLKALAERSAHGAGA
jgi:hypothetical protein